MDRRSRRRRPRRTKRRRNKRTAAPVKFGRRVFIGLLVAFILYWVGQFLGNLTGRKSPFSPDSREGIQFSWPFPESVLKTYDPKQNITSRYGPRSARLGWHTGIDLGGLPIGTPLVSVCPGVVRRTLSASGKNYGVGNTVMVQPDGLPFLISFQHCDKVMVSVGMRVNREVIATLGNTGFSTGPHLHIGFHFLSRKDVTDTKFGRFLTGTLKLPVDYADNSSKRFGPSFNPAPFLPYFLEKKHYA